MTEQEWVACKNPRPMLRYLLGLRPGELRVQDMESFPACRGSDRKLRLFACACYHRLSHLLPDDRARVAVETAERVADGLLPVEELERAEVRIREPLEALEPAWRASRGADRDALLPTHEALAMGLIALWREAQKAAYYASSNAHLAFAALDNPGAGVRALRRRASVRAEEQTQADLLRDMFGIPLFRPVYIEPDHLTSTVLALANGIYNDRAFDRLPLLADALLDAGCPDNELVAHCRSPGPHYKGCWIIDLILGKE